MPVTPLIWIPFASSLAMQELLERHLLDELLLPGLRRAGGPGLLQVDLERRGSRRSPSPA